jgi:DisA bacterial checkpoint controller nucleotide-binding
LRRSSIFGTTGIDPLCKRDLITDENTFDIGDAGDKTVMVNGRELADVFFDEARIFASSMGFQDAPNLTPDEKFAKATAQFPLPSPELIAYVIEEVFWASLLTEEARPCRPRLLYSPQREEFSRAVHRLLNPLTLTREQLRKLTPVQGPLGYLTWDSLSGKAEITGIEGRQGGDPCVFTIAAPNNGALDHSWSCMRLVTLRAGKVDRLSATALPDVHRALDVVRGLLGNFAPIFLGRTIRAIADQGHGGAIWIVGEGRTIEGIQLGYPIEQKENILPQDFAQRAQWLESVGHLAAVDGAVLLDSGLRVLGFGAFVNIPDHQAEVTYYSAGAVQKIKPESIGGGRHRSALEFCRSYTPAAAIVVSEDGRISVIWGTVEGVHCTPLSLLGLSDNII